LSIIFFTPSIKRPPSGSPLFPYTTLFRSEKDFVKFIQVRHEENAAFMACAHAKFTGQVGVCMATSGPGAIHLLNGLYDAKLDRRSEERRVEKEWRYGWSRYYYKKK